MILSCQNITKSFGVDEILKDASFHIEEHEKAAIVGINGAGKSTLLKIIIRQLTPDEGTVTVAKDKTIGYLAQNQDMDQGLTVYEEVLAAKQPVIDMEEEIRRMEERMDQVAQNDLGAFMEKYERLTHQFELADGYSYKSEVTGVLYGLGFEEREFDKKSSELSGGQKTRVALNYKGAVLIVSHDRYFLDKIVTKVIEVFQRQVYSYRGNYTVYAEKKAELREAQMRAWYNQQQEIRHQEEVIAKLKSGRNPSGGRRAGKKCWIKSNGWKNRWKTIPISISPWNHALPAATMCYRWNGWQNLLAVSGCLKRWIFPFTGGSGWR